MKKLRIAVAALAIMMAGTAACSADSIHDSINRIGVDRFAHVGVSYIISDQLRRNAHFNKFWAAATTLAIGAAFSYAVLRPLNASILALKDAVEDMRREMRESNKQRQELEVHLAEVDQSVRSAHHRIDALEGRAHG